MNLPSCGSTTKPVTIVSRFNTSHTEIWKSKNKQNEVKERKQNKENILPPKCIQKDKNRQKFYM